MLIITRMLLFLLFIVYCLLFFFFFCSLSLFYFIYLFIFSQQLIDLVSIYSPTSQQWKKLEVKKERKKKKNRKRKRDNDFIHANSFLGIFDNGASGWISSQSGGLFLSFSLLNTPFPVLFLKYEYFKCSFLYLFTPLIGPCRLWGDCQS